MRIIFMGSPDFAAFILEKMLAAQIMPIAVYSQPARAAKRGQKIQPTSTASLAHTHQIALYTPPKLDDDAYQQMKDLQPDLLIVTAYGLIIPERFLALAPYGGVNIHASLLPRWRGASPIEQAILHGEETSGITLMQIERALDSGAILTQKALPITESMTAIQLREQLQILGAEMIGDFVRALENGEVQEAVKQDETLVCYAPKLTRNDGLIDFQNQTAQAIERKVRALSPWPGAWCMRRGMRIILHEASWQPQDAQGTKKTAGTIISLEAGISIQCQEGVLTMTRLQRVGKNVLDWKAFLNGCPLTVGEAFGSE